MAELYARVASWLRIACPWLDADGLTDALHTGLMQLRTWKDGQGSTALSWACNKAKYAALNARRNRLGRPGRKRPKVQEFTIADDAWGLLAREAPVSIESSDVMLDAKEFARGLKRTDAAAFWWKFHGLTHVATAEQVGFHPSMVTYLQARWKKHWQHYPIVGMGA